MALEDRQLTVDQRAGRLEFRDIGDHGQHEAKLAAGRRPEAPHLRAEHSRTVERHADRAPAECGVVLNGPAEIGQHLVAADIERTKHDGRDRRHRGWLYRAGLLLEPRERRRDHELELGAEQADAVRARLIEMRQVEEEPGIDVQADALAVQGDRGTVRKAAYCAWRRARKRTLSA